MKSRVRDATEKLMLAGQKMTKYDVAVEAHCDQRTAQRVLAALHAAGKIRITRWVSIYRQKIPLYVFGLGKNAKKPAPISGKSRLRRVRSDPAYCMEELMQKRAKRAHARNHASRIKIPPPQMRSTALSGRTL